MVKRATKPLGRPMSSAELESASVLPPNDTSLSKAPATTTSPLVSTLTAFAYACVPLCGKGLSQSFLPSVSHFARITCSPRLPVSGSGSW